MDLKSLGWKFLHKETFGVGESIIIIFVTGFLIKFIYIIHHHVQGHTIDKHTHKMYNIKLSYD